LTELLSPLYFLLRFLHYTVLQKKKVHVPEMRPIYYCDSYEHIEKSYVRGLSRSKLVAEIEGSRVPIFCYLVIFSRVMFWMKNFEIHTIDRGYQKEHLEFFTEFFVHILRQRRGLKRKKRDFNTFEVV